MSWLTFFIAWFQMQGSPLTNDAWWDEYLNKLVGLNHFMLDLSWWIWGIIIGIIVVAVLVVVIFARGFELKFHLGCGLGGGFLFGLILLLLPLIAWINLQLVQGMANSFGPEGITNTGNFIVSLVLLIFLGLG